MDHILEELQRRVSEVRTGELMQLHTTFRIGGPADYYAIPENEQEIAEVIKYCKEAEVPYFVLGNGSNLLVSDDGYRGVVIQIFKNLQKCKIEEGTVIAESGALLSKIAASARDEELTGFEFASGIPGTVGGAVAMNAGAYGGEMKDVLESVRILDEKGIVRELLSSELKMGYRTSLVKEKNWIVLSAKIHLQKGKREEIRAKMDDFKGRRTEKQPLQYPSAGSTFKRPEGFFAGKLIQDAGFRGYRVGGAQVSEKHCGFVINTGDATAKDVKQLIEDVRIAVKEKFGVMLEPEVRFLGF